ncbi:MAG TPA: GatB/YqeY domain-containing protein [Anaerolineales bacterium]|nr:GatB/YqeY domain-containing protein [Anaerolineales bacterium]
MITREELEKQLKEAMRASDEPRKRTLRMILAAVKLAEVEKRAALDEAAMRSILQREVKTRQESLADAERAGRAEMAQDVKTELEIVQSYLPAAMPADELEALVRQAMAEVDASAPGDVGKVMKALMPLIQGRADGREVNQVVRRLLGG